MRKLICVSLASLFSAAVYAAVAPVPVPQSPLQSQIRPEAQTSVFQQPTVKGQPTMLNPGAPVLSANGYFLQDINSGKVLASQNPDVRMAPASLTKLMTLYLTFEALQANRIHLNDKVTISTDAWQTGGSRMFVKAGDQVAVSDLIQGVIVDSGNDACTALAEYVGGTQPGFVNLMNQQAQLLGMKNTHYVDVTGLPDPNHYSTPRDIGVLARAIILNFPQYYHFFGEKTLTYDNITQPNRNRLLWSDPSVDGLKTGHTDAAGYCLVSSADRNGMRLLSVLLGAPTDAARSLFSEDLLNYGYRFFETHKVYAADQALQNATVYFGKTNLVPVGLSRDFYVTVPAGEYSKVTTNFKLFTPLKAPLKQGEAVGSVGVVLNGQPLGSENLVALSSVQRGGLVTRLVSHVKLALGKI
ncbi:MAG TPA: D-alanyl-D-alanine carboxypeptidase family protein [Gammaproteobacteria bacterium]|nr:D-alanyl-D-alanine carboxypeptidase family protein [Gammaproteobacteria bacterium]